MAGSGECGEQRCGLFEEGGGLRVSLLATLAQHVPAKLIGFEASKLSARTFTIGAAIRSPMLK